MQEKKGWMHGQLWRLGKGGGIIQDVGWLEGKGLNGEIVEDKA